MYFEFWFPAKVTIPLLSWFKAMRPDHPDNREHYFGA